MKVKVKPLSCDVTEDLSVHCQRISKKNNSLLYQLENYLGKKLLSDEKLMEIRDLILTVSGDVSRIAESIVVVGDDDERL